MPATRVEIADSIADAFIGGPMSGADLLAVAKRAGARVEVLAELERLPRGPFYELRQLWGCLADVPIENESCLPTSGASS